MKKGLGKGNLNPINGKFAALLIRNGYIND